MLKAALNRSSIPFFSQFVQIASRVWQEKRRVPQFGWIRYPKSGMEKRWFRFFALRFHFSELDSSHLMLSLVLARGIETLQRWRQQGGATELKNMKTRSRRTRHDIRSQMQVEPDVFAILCFYRVFADNFCANRG